MYEKFSKCLHGRVTSPCHGLFPPLQISEEKVSKYVIFFDLQILSLLLKPNPLLRGILRALSP